MNIFALTAGDAVQREDIGPIADFFHGGASQVIAQFRVAGKNDGKAAVATLHQFHQALEAGQCMPVEIMRFIDEQRDWSLVLLHQFAQIAFAFFALCRDSHLPFG